MASCMSNSRPCGTSVCLTVFFHSVRESCRQSRWCFEGVFHLPFSCQMHSTRKGSIAFGIFIVVTLVTPPFSNRLVVRRSDEPLIGSTDKGNCRQKVFGCGRGGGEEFDGIVMLYKTYCSQIAFSGYKESVIPWCCFLPLCPHMR